MDHPVNSIYTSLFNSSFALNTYGNHACMHAKSFQYVRFFATPWTVACQAPLSIGLSRQEYYSGLPCPPPGDLPDSGIKPTSPVASALQADSLPLVPPGKLLCGQQLKLNMKRTRVIYIFRKIIYHLFYFWLCWAFIAAQAFL